jgi:hypothetical protein
MGSWFTLILNIPGAFILNLHCDTATPLTNKATKNDTWFVICASQIHDIIQAITLVYWKDVVSLSIHSIFVFVR